jgi:hypothetical protein
MAPRYWILIAAVLVALVAGVMFLSSPDESAPETRTVPERTPAPPAPETEPTPAPEPPAVPNPAPEPEPEPVTLPPLGASDDFVRDRAGSVAEDAALDRVLSTDQLVRRFTVVVENLAEGSLARDPLAFMAPSGSFQATRRDGTLVIAPATYERYDGIAAMVEAVRPQQAVGLLRLIEPLVGDAYSELGEQDADIEARLAAAIDLMLATPEVEGPIELTQPTVAYEFADPELEALAPSQKLLLRMGPENRAIVREKLRAIRALIDG